MDESEIKVNGINPNTLKGQRKTVAGSNMFYNPQF